MAIRLFDNFPAFDSTAERPTSGLILLSDGSQAWAASTIASAGIPVGTGAANAVALWSGANTLTYDASLTFASSVLTVPGDVLPSAANTYNLGSTGYSGKTWKDFFIRGEQKWWEEDQSANWTPIIEGTDFYAANNADSSEWIEIGNVSLALFGTVELKMDITCGYGSALNGGYASVWFRFKQQSAMATADDAPDYGQFVSGDSQTPRIAVMRTSADLGSPKTYKIFIKNAANNFCSYAIKYRYRGGTFTIGTHATDGTGYYPTTGTYYGPISFWDYLGYSTTASTSTTAPGATLRITNQDETTAGNASSFVFRTPDSGGTIRTAAAFKAVYASRSASNVTTGLAWMTDDGSGLAERMWLTSGGNLALGLSAAGTSATKTFAQGNGTAPSAGVTDGYQLYSADYAAGDAGAFIRPEITGPTIHKFVSLYELDKTDAVTNAVTTMQIWDHKSSGTAAAGFGISNIWKLQSSTTASQTAASINVSWSTATHASRKADMIFYAWDTAAREFMRGQGNGSAAAIGFFGVTPVVRPTALTVKLTALTHTAPGTPDYAIQNLTNSGGYGFVTQDEGNTVLKTIVNIDTRVNELETKLQALGLLT